MCGGEADWISGHILVVASVFAVSEDKIRHSDFLLTHLQQSGCGVQQKDKRFSNVNQQAECHVLV